ncbi:hypothetical protein L1887_07753 [Cichorium endivia]|nr:hypothetical protein L1887_07753 [Cichorium endivia]
MDSCFSFSFLVTVSCVTIYFVYIMWCIVACYGSFAPKCYLSSGWNSGLMVVYKRILKAVHMRQNKE